MDFFQSREEDEHPPPPPPLQSKAMYQFRTTLKLEILL